MKALVIGGLTGLLMLLAYLIGWWAVLVVFIIGGIYVVRGI